MHAGAPAGAPPIVPQLPIIRTRTEGEQRATFFELFFDLVYVFAVTQLSHHLLADISWSGAAETAFMLVALYWAWNYTTWMTNWFDPDTVRLVLVFVMLASLLLAVAIPEGFGGHALLFACAYSGFADRTEYLRRCGHAARRFQPELSPDPRLERALSATVGRGRHRRCRSVALGAVAGCSRS